MAEKLVELVRPLFVVGAMRSGTTLLAELLGRSAAVAHCRFELKDVWSAAGVPMASPKTRDIQCAECGNGAALPGMAASLAAAFAERMSLLTDKAPDAFLLNKNPHLCNKLPLVEALFPDARVLWIHRDLPRVAPSLKRLFADVLRRQQTWHFWPHLRGDEGDRQNRCWHTVFSEVAAQALPSDRLFPGGDMQHLARYWFESNRAVSAFVRSRPSTTLEVAEEELVTDPNRTLARIHAWLGIAAPAPVTEKDGVDTERDARWHADLSPHELHTLREFLLDHGGAIDEVFARSGKAAHMVGSLYETGGGGS